MSFTGDAGYPWQGTTATCRPAAVQSSFAGAMQALLLLATLAATFLAAPALVAYCARRVLSVGPAASGKAAGTDGVSTPRKGQQLSRNDGRVHTKPRACPARLVAAASSAFHAVEEVSSHGCIIALAGWRSAVGWPLDRLAAADAWACDQLRANIRPLVSAGLIVSTLLGAVLLAAFFTVQIGRSHS